MMRAWGLIARRRHSRIKRSSHVFLCVGHNAVHFFTSGQKPFAPPAAEQEPMEDQPVALPASEPSSSFAAARTASPEADDADEAYVSLDDGDEPQPEKSVSQPAFVAPPTRSAELFRIDRWHVRDIGPRGMSLACDAGIGSHLRVGDLVGLQQVNAMGRWNVAVVRWLKTPEPDTLEIGIELLGADVRPAAVRSVATASRKASNFVQAIWVPAIESLHQPPTLLMPRGVSQTDADLELIIESEPLRRVRVLKRSERSNAFEQIVFAEVVQEEALG
jgi:cyclic-di-GMP-binding protein